MTDASSQNSKTFREQIGPAIWLFALLTRFTPADWTGDESAWIAAGNAISDPELSERLQVSLPTIATWRRRLHKAGLLGWLVAPGIGRVFFLTAVNQVLGASLNAPPQLAREALATPSASVAVWRVIQERSIALTGKVVEDLNTEEVSRLANALGGESCLPTKVSE